MTTIRMVAALSTLALTAWSTEVVHAQPASGTAAPPYPSKPIRIVTGTVASNSDFLSRLIAQGISGPLGQPVVVDNRGSGFLAAEAVAKAPPDGYAVFINASAWYIATLFQKQTYDPDKDFSPITITSSTPNILVVHPSLPVKSARELIALAKAKPGELNYGAAGIGGAGHLATELFKSMAGVSITAVPYKGSGRSVTALVAGEIQIVFSDYEPLEPHVKAGKLRPLAITTAQPSELFPGLPTLAAAVPGFVAIANSGVLAPARTPAPIISRLNQEIVRFLKTPEAKERILRTGSEVVASSPDELAAWIKADMARWGKVIQDLGLASR